MENFYDNLDLKYPEIAILSQGFNKHNSGLRSFYIPVLMPYRSNNNTAISTPIRTPDLKNDNKNIGLTSYTTSSSIKLKIPRYIESSIPSDEYGNVSAGIEFYVVFIGGDINKPRIIGGNF